MIKLQNSGKPAEVKHDPGTIRRCRGLKPPIRTFFTFRHRVKLRLLPGVAVELPLKHLCCHNNHTHVWVRHTSPSAWQATTRYNSTNCCRAILRPAPAQHCDPEGFSVGLSSQWANDRKTKRSQGQRGHSEIGEAYTQAVSIGKEFANRAQEEPRILLLETEQRIEVACDHAVRRLAERHLARPAARESLLPDTSPELPAPSAHDRHPSVRPGA